MFHAKVENLMRIGAPNAVSDALTVILSAFSTRKSLTFFSCASVVIAFLSAEFEYVVSVKIFKCYQFIHLLTPRAFHGRFLMFQSFSFSFCMIC